MMDALSMLAICGNFSIRVCKLANLIYSSFDSNDKNLMYEYDFIYLGRSMVKYVNDFLFW
jgi:hypothetical protein